MKTTRLLILIITLFLTFSCNKPKLETRTIVSGQVINRASDDLTVIQWNICDPFCDDREWTRLSKEGHFLMESDDISLLHNMTLRYDSFINFFAQPGDSIHILIDAKKLKAGDADAIYFSGDRADDNNEQYKYYDYIMNIISADYYNPINLDVQPKLLIAQLNERLDKYKDSLASYDKSQNMTMSENLKDFLHRDMIFYLANDLLDYKIDSTDVRLELFTDPLFSIDDSLNLSTMMFTAHLNAYIYTKISSDSIIQTTSKQLDNVTLIRRVIDILKNEPASINRDAMSWSILSYMIEKQPILYDSIPTAQTLFTTSKLNDKFATLVRKYDTKVVIPKTVLKGVSYLELDGSVTTLPEVDIFTHLAEKYPNKVLYIDIFSTWCGPCRNEMRHHGPALHNSMKGKDVVFINLCLGSGTDEWHNIISQFGLTENYWFDDYCTLLFMSSYNISGYPTYILMGKDGEVAKLDAARPSNLGLITKQIQELL